MRFFDETLIYPIRTYHRNCISHYLKKKKDIFSSLSYLLTGQCGRRKNATLQLWNIGEIGLNIVYRVHDVEENSGNLILFILPLQNYYLDKWYRFFNYKNISINIGKIISGHKILCLVNAHLYFTTRALKTLYHLI